MHPLHFSKSSWTRTALVYVLFQPHLDDTGFSEWHIKFQVPLKFVSVSWMKYLDFGDIPRVYISTDDFIITDADSKEHNERLGTTHTRNSSTRNHHTAAWSSPKCQLIP